MANWMRKQSAKEVGHACTIAEYMVKREATPKVDKVDVVPQGWGNSLEVFEHSLEHEKHISKLIDELVYLASEEKDNATQDFLWKFVREQVEEEAGVQNIVNLLKKAGDMLFMFQGMFKNFRPIMVASKPSASEKQMSACIQS